MATQIHLSCFPTSSNMLEELVDKLENSGRTVKKNVINNIGELSSILNSTDCDFEAIMLKQEDILAISREKNQPLVQLRGARSPYPKLVAICIDCSEIPLFLSDIFFIKEVRGSIEEIRRGIVQVHNQITQSKKGRYGYFVGRNNEIEQFQNIFYSERHSRINALIVSGRPGVGREAYVRECIRQQKRDEIYEPYILSMGKNGNVELFLIQLNSIHHLYSENEMLNILGSGTEGKVEVAVAMLNDLFGEDNYLMLYDDGAACVFYNRDLSDWFKSIVSHPKLNGGMHLYVISNISVSYSRIKTDDDIAYITLYGLTLSDRKKLIYKHLSELDLVLEEDQVSFLADNLVYSPNQLIKAVDDIKRKNFKSVKDRISTYQIAGDNKILSLLNRYFSAEFSEAKNILVLLSRIEYVSKDILDVVFPDTKKEVEQQLDVFMADGIVERFGEWLDLVRLDSSISDYIRRNKIDYSEKHFSAYVTEILDELLKETPRITENYASYLYQIKRRVQQGKITQESYLVPSILVNSIAESYDDKKWEQTIMLCECVKEAHPDYFEDIYREINYWYCLALARVQNGDKFYMAVNEFYSADYHFLKGFYFRIGKEYAKAEEEYRKALSINQSLQRAKREMVIVLQAQHKFKAAFEMAEMNYEKEPENAYHLHAYFRCLVRKNGITFDDRELLVRLKKNARDLFKSNYFWEGMEFEYKRFIDRIRPDELLPMAYQLRDRYKNITYINDITDDYFVSQGLKAHLYPIDYSDEFNY